MLPRPTSSPQMKLLFFLILVIGGCVWAFILSQKSLPGDFIYPLKSLTEEGRLALTEFDNLKRADIYITFAHYRLTELEELEEKGARPALLLKVAEKLWEEEQASFRKLDQAAKLNDISIRVKRLKDLRQKQESILNKILDKTPEPEFYSILDIKEKSLEAIDNLK